MQARFVKLLIDTGVGHAGNNGIYTVGELKIFDSSGTNIAQGKTATARASYGGSAPEQAVDGVAMSYPNFYATPAGVGTSPNGSEWLKIDLGTAINIKSYELCTYYGNGYGILTGYRIAVSLDDIDYQVIYTDTDKAAQAGGQWRKDTGVFTTTKYLANLLDGSIMKYANSTWVSIDTPVLTEALFKTEGMDLIPSPSVLEQLPNSFKMLTWTDDSAVMKLRTIAIPFNKLVLANGDIGTTAIQSINSVTCTSTVNGASKLSIILSIDRGKTWLTWDNGWTTINPVAADAASFGITPIQLATLTKQNWLDLDVRDTLRFGYYLELAANANICSTDLLTMSIDMRGRWRTEAPKADYNHYFINNETIQIELLSTGDFKINY